MVGGTTARAGLPNTLNYGSFRGTADIGSGAASIESAGFDPGCVKTLRGMIAPEILRRVVMRRAKKRKNLSSARHYDQVRSRFHTTKTRS
jgi:hypothetical protein